MVKLLFILDKIKNSSYNFIIFYFLKIHLLLIILYFFPNRNEAFIINRILNLSFIIIVFLTILISIFFIPTYNKTSNIKIINFIDDGHLLWPAPRNIKN